MIIESQGLEFKGKVDKTTAIRQLLYMGAEEYVMRLYADGRISLSRAAELLETSVHDILRIAERKGLHAGATQGQQERSEATAAGL